MTWDFSNGQVTGTVKFDANNKTGGTLDYQASNGMWLHGVVAPGTYQQIDAHTAVFGGEITSGSDDYTVNHDGTDYFTVKIVDGGTSGGNGDIIAVLANQDGYGNWLTSPDPTTSRDYPMDAAHGRDRHRRQPDRLLIHSADAVSRAASSAQLTPVGNIRPVASWCFEMSGPSNVQAWRLG